MKSLLVLGALLGLGLAHDAVFWGAKSEEDKSAKERKVDRLGKLVKSASSECPLVVFLAPRFSLGDFSRMAGVYSAEGRPAIPVLKASMLQSAGYQSLDMTGGPSEDLEAVPEKVLYYREPKDLAEAGKSAVMVVEGEDLRDLEAKAKEILASLSGKCFRAILTGVESGPSEENLAKRRSKRAAAGPTPGNPADPGLAYGNIAGTTPYGKWIAPGGDGCPQAGALAFVNGSTVLDASGKPSGPLDFQSGSWKCLNFTSAGKFVAVKASANLTMNFGGTAGTPALKLTLDFALTSDDYWSLTGATGTYGKNTASLSYANLMTLYLVSIRGNSFACGQTDYIWFTDGKKTRLFAFSLQNFQVEPFAGARPAWVPALDSKNPAFTDFVDDCVPFFSPGVWMGFVSLVILLLTLIFGLTMIASLKTMDKFDDPKGKQLNINAKD